MTGFLLSFSIFISGVSEKFKIGNHQADTVLREPRIYTLKKKKGVILSKT